MATTLSRLSDSTVLITGGTGFVGANLVRALIGTGCKVHLLLRPGARLWRLRGIGDKVVEHTVDFADAADVQNCIEKVQPDVVFHLAAHGAYPAETDLSRMLQVNVAGTANLLSALKAKRPACRLVYAGSSSEYGYKDHPMAESEVLAPASLYAATKAAGTHLCQVFARYHGQPAVAVRLFSIYGYYEEPTRFVPTAILAALRKKPLLLHTGLESRDYVFVEDVIEALALAAVQPGIDGEVFNVGSGRQTTTKQVAEAIREISAKDLDIRLGSYPARPWETSYWLADTKKTTEGLGWSARHSLSQGLEKTIEWFSKEENASLYP